MPESTGSLVRSDDFCTRKSIFCWITFILNSLVCGSSSSSDTLMFFLKEKTQCSFPILVLACLVFPCHCYLKHNLISSCAHTKTERNVVKSCHKAVQCKAFSLNSTYKQAALPFSGCSTLRHTLTRTECKSRPCIVNTHSVAYTENVMF